MENRMRKIKVEDWEKLEASLNGNKVTSIRILLDILKLIKAEKIDKNIRLDPISNKEVKLAERR